MGRSMCTDKAPHSDCGYRLRSRTAEHRSSRMRRAPGGRTRASRSVSQGQGGSSNPERKEKEPCGNMCRVRSRGGSARLIPAARASAEAPRASASIASTNAQLNGAAFGADISSGAQFASEPNFGAGVVASYAHLPRETC